MSTYARYMCICVLCIYLFTVYNLHLIAYNMQLQLQPQVKSSQLNSTNLIPEHVQTHMQVQVQPKPRQIRVNHPARETGSYMLDMYLTESRSGSVGAVDAGVSGAILAAWRN